MVLGQALDLPEYIQMLYYEGRSTLLRTLGARNELRSASPPHRVNDAIQPCHPLLPSPLAFNLSQHQDLSNESALRIRWPKYWSFSCSISPSNEYSGLISFRMDRFDLLAVQGTLKSLLQHHKSINSLGLSFLYGPTLTSVHN